jgi:hypothetical protein
MRGPAPIARIFIVVSSAHSTIPGIATPFLEEEKMLMESLEARCLMSASPVAELAQAGGMASLAQSAPKAVKALAVPAVANTGAKPREVPPQKANAVAALAKDGSISTTAKSEAGAVGKLARHS